MLMGRQRLALPIVWSLLLVIGGCDVSEKQGQFACQTDAECPTGWMCNTAGDGHCYSPEMLAAMDTLMDSGSSGNGDTATTVATDDSESGSAGTDTGGETDSATTVTIDTSSQDSEDTGADSDTDTLTSADTGTDVDTATVDSAIDTGSESAVDTVGDTDVDTVDTSEDTGTDTAMDTGTGVDTDSDSITDTGTDTDTGLIANNCTQPINVPSVGGTFDGSFSDYGDSFSQSNPAGCGDGVRDVWFMVSMPGKSMVTVSESTAAEVVIREVADCLVTTCVGFSDTVEQYHIENKANVPKILYVVVSKSPASAVDDFSVSFTF